MRRGGVCVCVCVLERERERERELRRGGVAPSGRGAASWLVGSD